jgi:hypothetical protein
MTLPIGPGRPRAEGPTRPPYGSHRCPATGCKPRHKHQGYQFGQLTGVVRVWRSTPVGRAGIESAVTLSGPGTSSPAGLREEAWAHRRWEGHHTGTPSHAVPVFAVKRAAARPRREADAVSLVHAVEVPRRPLSLLEPVIGGPRYLRLRAAGAGRDAAADCLSSSGAPTDCMPSAEEPGRRVRPSGHCAGGGTAGRAAPRPRRSRHWR